MKRWIVNAGICGYLAALLFGFLCVACQVQFFSVPMYFLTFNMYGSWSGYDCKMQVLGEGQSGKFYVLSPGPWGAFNPYSSRLSRQCYDQVFEYGKFLARPGLSHTQHEPILRMFVVEQEYPKKFNLSDAQYQAYYEKPNPHRIYSHTRMVLTPEGEILAESPTWLRYQDNQSVVDNPRLFNEATHNRPFIWSSQPATGPQDYSGNAYPSAAKLERVGSPVAE
ncbi:MAG TPA: hypothetical protein VFG04_11960 [Planctomycetaceae bacterium]|jgi:hypothetical protein|nr:hypothetical protein [Planctomycetaceae bacterium]